MPLMPNRRDDLPPMRRAVSDALDEVNFRMHGMSSSWAYPDEFVEFLAGHGFEVTAVRPPTTEDLRTRAREWITGYNDATEEGRVNCVALFLCAAEDAYQCAAESHRSRLAGYEVVEVASVGAHALLADAEAEVERLKAAVAHYENTICWDTTCHGCAKTLDAAVRETQRAEEAEARLARVRAVAAEWGEPGHCSWLSASVLVRQLRAALDDPMPESGAVEVIELTEDEYDKAVADALSALGLTYEQLAEQARTGDYSPPDARALWLRIKPLPKAAPDA